MLKFSSVLAFVAIIAASLLFFFAAEAEARQYPKWTKLTTGYSYEQYLKDANKAAPADPLEYSMREKLFLASLKEVMTHNAKPNQLYKKGINKFSDRTREEFRALNGGLSTKMVAAKERIRAKLATPHVVGAARSSPYPVAWDWRDFKPQVISAPKSQQICGDCWAHAATETLESHYAIATGDLFVMSQQQVTACTPNPNQCGGTGGCGGSIAELAYEYIITNGGITEEWQYPFTAGQGETGKCLWPSATASAVAKFSGFKVVASNDANSVMDAIMNAGPLAVNVDASTWNDYESGIFDGCNYANNISIDHVVQMVGWGYDAALDNAYWTIRNSWSASYGENGYIRILRQPGAEQCGWNVNAQDGTACKGQPSTQWTCGQCGVLFDTSYPVPIVPNQ